MALIRVIRILTLSIFINVIVPSGDVYSDIMLMYQTWTFRNTESLEMSGCRACFGKTDEDLLLRSKGHCIPCITKKSWHAWGGCGKLFKAINKLLELESRNECDDSKWRVYGNGTLEEGKCRSESFWGSEKRSHCCFETKSQKSEMNQNCGVDVCSLHLEVLEYYLKNLDLWKIKTTYVEGTKIGGKSCYLNRIYSKSMLIPIALNLLLSAVMFYQDVKSGHANKFEITFLLLLFYPQWKMLKTLMKYLKNKDEQELINNVAQNDREFPLFEPFCESGLQVLISLCIVFNTEGFYPKDGYGNSLNKLPLSVSSFFISLFACSFGITKFFLTGPLPLLPQDAPLAGILSLKFLVFLFLNTMFVARVFCLEASFFANYRSSRNALNQVDATISEEYRLPIYLFPGICSFVVNLIKLVITTKKSSLKYFLKHPQFILCPIFCPLMFEGNPKISEENNQPIRVWVRASILNAVFMGCIPQILLVALDYHKRVRFWPFHEIDVWSGYDTNALIKHPYGSTIFSVSTLVSYGFLICIFFVWDKCLFIRGTSTNASAANEKQEIGTLELQFHEKVESKNDASAPCSKQKDMKVHGSEYKLAKSKRKKKIISVFVLTIFCLGLFLAIFYTKYRFKSDDFCRDTLPLDYQCVKGCPDLAKIGHCYAKWNDQWNEMKDCNSNATNYVYQDCKQSCNNCDLTSCKNDSECDHSNCHYCTSAGYCRSYGIRKYCDVYDCGIGDGSCFSYDGVSYCKSNLTCKRNRFLDYHPLLAKCLRDDVSNNKPKYYTACVSKDNSGLSCGECIITIENNGGCDCFKNNCNPFGAGIVPVGCYETLRNSTCLNEVNRRFSHCVPQNAAEPQPITSETAKDAFKINQPNTTTKQQGNEEGGKQDAQNAN